MASKSAFSFELTGIKEMAKLLDELPTKAMQKTVVRNALKKACQPIANLASEIAPYDPKPTKGYEQSKHFKDTLIVSASLKKSQRRGKRWYDRTRVTMYIGSTAPHAHLLEFGTKERVLKEPRLVKFPSGKFARITTTGRLMPNPFMRTAWDTLKHGSLKIIAHEMKVQLYRAAARLRRRAEAGKLTRTQIRGILR